MLSESPIVFLFDVDNTLLDNDRFSADLDARLERDFGVDGRKRYRTIYARLRDEHGYADYLGAVQEFRQGAEDLPALLQLAEFMLVYPFKQCVYPGALDAIQHLATIGRCAILSDGDMVFQPRKIQRSGLWDALQGRVLVTLHKQDSIELVRRRWPARRYVTIDDKPQLLAAMKRLLGDALFTVFVEQGHYARESLQQTSEPAPDLRIQRIQQLCELSAADFEPAGSRAQPQ